MKLCKDRVSNFDGGLWHFLQETFQPQTPPSPNPLQEIARVRLGARHMASNDEHTSQLCNDRRANMQIFPRAL